MKDVLTNAIREAIRCYILGSQSPPSRKRFYLTIHPETTKVLMDTPDWRINFDGDEMTKHWERTTIIEDLTMKFGHFSLDIKDKQ